MNKNFLDDLRRHRLNNGILVEPHRSVAPHQSIPGILTMFMGNLWTVSGIRGMRLYQIYSRLARRFAFEINRYHENHWDNYL